MINFTQFFLKKVSSAAPKTQLLELLTRKPLIQNLRKIKSLIHSILNKQTKSLCDAVLGNHFHDELIINGKRILRRFLLFFSIRIQLFLLHQ